jgi:hypothetical protein
VGVFSPTRLLDEGEELLSEEFAEVAILILRALLLFIPIGPTQVSPGRGALGKHPQQSLRTFPRGGRPTRRPRRQARTTKWNPPSARTTPNASCPIAVPKKYAKWKDEPYQPRTRCFKIPNRNYSQMKRRPTLSNSLNPPTSPSAPSLQTPRQLAEPLGCRVPF